MSDSTNRNLPPDWAFTFHGHRCPFMPLGYRMGLLALDALGVSREADHTLHVICELGDQATGRPFGRMMEHAQDKAPTAVGGAVRESKCT